MPFDSKQPSGPGVSTGRCVPAPNVGIQRTMSIWGPTVAGPNSTPMGSPVRAGANGLNRIRLASASDAEPCWWTAEINAQELMRQIPGAGPVLPVPVDEIKDRGISTSKLWCEVSWHRDGIGDRAVFDIGAGMRINIHACTVQMDLIVPPRSVIARGPILNDPNGVSTLDGPGLFLDNIVRGSIICGCAASKNGTLLTQTFIIAPGSTIFVPTPPGAIGVDVYGPGAALGGVAGAWVEFGDPTDVLPPSGPLAAINFLTIAADRTGIIPRPGNAAGIATVNPDLGTAVVTYVWQLEY